MRSSVVKVEMSASVTFYKWAGGSWCELWHMSEAEAGSHVVLCSITYRVTSLDIARI